MTKKEKIDRILYESHLVINGSTGTDITKSSREEARKKSRKILKELKDFAPEVYNIVKEEFNG
jgi:hypothetical protein